MGVKNRVWILKEQPQGVGETTESTSLHEDLKLGPGPLQNKPDFLFVH